MAWVLTLDDGKEMYTLTVETSHAWCAILRKLWRMSSISSLVALLMLHLGSEVQIFSNKVEQ